MQKRTAFQIWCEGDPDYNYTAYNIGFGWGTCFLEACEDLASRNAYFNKVWNRNTMKYWGCRLFDNYEEARKSFG